MSEVVSTWTTTENDEDVQEGMVKDALAFVENVELIQVESQFDSEVHTVIDMFCGLKT